MTATLSMADRLAITDVVYRFFWLVDHGRADETADLFTADASLTFGPGSPKPGTISGATIRPAMIARAAQTSVTTRHVLSNLAFETASDGSVAVYSLLTLFRSEDANLDITPASVADIEEVFIREGERWKIRSRLISPVFNRK